MFAQQLFFKRLDRLLWLCLPMKVGHPAVAHSNSKSIRLSVGLSKQCKDFPKEIIGAGTQSNINVIFSVVSQPIFTNVYECVTNERVKSQYQFIVVV